MNQEQVEETYSVEVQASEAQSDSEDVQSDAEEVKSD